eukprot:1195080-Prorocentrum_minimum.AAC.5
MTGLALWLAHVWYAAPAPICPCPLNIEGMSTPEWEGRRRQSSPLKAASHFSRRNNFKLCALSDFLE